MQSTNLNDTEHPAYLFVARPGAPPQVAPLEENNSLFVGSGSNCRVVLQGPGVEPIHCMFWMNEQRVVRVQDWNTVLGVSINGQTVSTEAVLNSGDELKIGEIRIVTVLSPEVHQRLSGQIVEPESIQQVDQVTPDIQQSADEPTLAESDNLSVEEVATQPVSPPFQTEEESECHESPESEAPAFEYDVMADLDSVDLADAELTDESGFDGMGFELRADFDESRNEEMELLRMEVDQLRFELAERDAQLNSFSKTSLESEPASEEDGQTIQLVNRLEELLEELQVSDDRVRGLEDILRASDQATQAERDERLQLESWVTEIEQRVAERESESEAELNRLNSQLAETLARHKQTKIQLKKVLQSNSDGSSAASDDLIPALRAQVEELEKRLESASNEVEQLRKQGVCEEKRAVSQDAFHELEQKLLQQQVESSRERAEMSRQRAELEQLKSELEEKLRTVKKTGNGDARLQAMRQHLREIHEAEKVQMEEKRQRSLGGRISRLLGSSNG